MSSLKLCLPGNLNSECVEAFPLSPTNGLFRTIFWVKLSYLLIEAHSPKVLNNECAGYFVHSFICISNNASTHVMTQIWLPHCKYEPHIHYAKWEYRLNIFADIYQIQTLATATLQNIIAKYVPERNRLLKCLIYVTCTNHLMPWYETTITMLVYLTSTLQSTVWSGAQVYLHFTLLAYAPEQICLLHQTCMSHCTNTVLYM